MSCEVCAGDTFEFVEGQWTCVICHTVSNRKVEQGHDSDDGSAGRNYVRAKRLRLEPRLGDMDDDRPKWDYAELYQNVLKEQLRQIQGKGLLLELGDKVDTVARSLWFRWLAKGGLWNASRVGKGWVLSLKNIECTLCVVLAAIRIVGVDFGASTLVDLVFRGEVPLYDPLSWLQLHREWQPVQVPVLDNRALLVLSPELPQGAVAQMNPAHWKALLGPRGAYHAKACGLMSRILQGASDVCALCQVILPQPPVKSLLRLAETLIISKMRDEADRDVVRGHLTVIVGAELAKHDPKKSLPFPESECSAALVLVAMKMINYRDLNASPFFDDVLGRMEPRKTDVLWKGGELSGAHLRPLVFALESLVMGRRNRAAAIGVDGNDNMDDINDDHDDDDDDDDNDMDVIEIQEPPPLPPHIPPSVANEQPLLNLNRDPLDGLLVYPLSNHWDKFPDSHLLLMGTYAGRLAHCTVWHLLRQLKRIERFSSNQINDAPEWLKLLDRICAAQKLGQTSLSVNSLRDLQNARGLAKKFAFPLDWTGSTVLTLDRHNGAYSFLEKRTKRKNDDDEDDDQEEEEDQVPQFASPSPISRHKAGPRYKASLPPAPVTREDDDDDDDDDYNDDDLDDENGEEEEEEASASVKVEMDTPVKVEFSSQDSSPPVVEFSIEGDGDDGDINDDIDDDVDDEHGEEEEEEASASVKVEPVKVEFSSEDSSPPVVEFSIEGGGDDDDD